MELRSSSKKKEYKNLKYTLMGLGLYEEGMTLDEMKQILDALEESQLECETTFFENDMERALKESEMDFMQMHCNAHSSTMIKQPVVDDNFNIIRHVSPRHKKTTVCLVKTNTSPFSSPEIMPKKIVVEAVVHKELDWSPQKSKSLNDERLPDNLPRRHKNNVNNNNVDIEETNNSFLKQRSIPPSIFSPIEETGFRFLYDSMNMSRDNEESNSYPSF